MKTDHVFISNQMSVISDKMKKHPDFTYVRPDLPYEIGFNYQGESRFYLIPFFEGQFAGTYYVGFKAGNYVPAIGPKRPIGQGIKLSDIISDLKSYQIRKSIRTPV